MRQHEKNGEKTWTEKKDMKKKTLETSNLLEDLAFNGNRR